MEILDGKSWANQIIAGCGRLVSHMEKAPTLAVILVGDNPASEVYVRNKVKACERAGIMSKVIRFPASTTYIELADAIRLLNCDDDITGIMVQMPLPKHINPNVVDEINYEKDVDSLTVVNRGRLFKGMSGLKPCTPAGIMELLRHYNVNLRGKNVVIIGRSDLVGRPLAAMMERADATVTVCHSKSQYIGIHTRCADIVVTAVGRPNFLTGDMIKYGAIVIDVGINKIGNKIVGDCDDDVKERAGMLTPVPGGVGCMTVSMLIENTVRAATLKDYYGQ